MEEHFSDTHHKIISGLGTILSSLNANSGIMAIFMYWGDTQNSQNTLQMLNDYIDEYLDVKVLNLKDKNGVELPIDCIIYGSLVGQTEKHYFNLGRCQNDLSNEMIACTYGYVHNVEQKDLVNFEFVGLTKDNLHLLECD